MNKRVSLVGVGMDGLSTLTEEGRKAVEEAQVLVGAKRMTGLFADLGKPCLAAWRGEEIARYIADCEYETAAVLLSGDCGFYSGAKALLPLLGDCQVRVVSGIASPVCFAARLQMPWQDWHFVSLHGTEAPVVRPVRAHEKTFFLLGGAWGPGEVCARLKEYGLGRLAVALGENLAQPGEKVTRGTAEELAGYAAAPLSVLLVENPNYEPAPRCCIPDGEFIRGRTPMTKAEVRALCVAKLRPGRRDICWDIGAGTGSVSVELAMQCQEGKVFAVDRDPAALDLMEQNRRRFGCDNMEPAAGPALEVIPGLPAPDCVFVGGSGGELPGILRKALDKNPRARVVITAVSLETLEQARTVLTELGRPAEVTQLAVTRTRKTGSHTMLAAENPIYMIEGGQP